MIVKALAILLPACLIGLGVQTWRASHYKTQVITFKSAVLTFESAQKTNLATIATLQSANAEWASKCKADQPKARQQAQESAQADAKRQAGVAKSIKSLQATYEHEPTAKAWADTRVPAAVADRLREAGDPD